MTSRSKLLTAASAIAMALAVGSLQAAEPLTTDQLDTIAAGAAGQSSSFSTGTHDNTAAGGASVGAGVTIFAQNPSSPNQIYPVVTCPGPCSVSFAGQP